MEGRGYPRCPHCGLQWEHLPGHGWHGVRERCVCGATLWLATVYRDCGDWGVRVADRLDYRPPTETVETT